MHFASALLLAIAALLAAGCGVHRPAVVNVADFDARSPIEGRRPATWDRTSLGGRDREVYRSTSESSVHYVYRGGRDPRTGRADAGAF